MHKSHLHIHLRATSDKESILKMFFQDWADELCNNEVSYSTVASDGGGRLWWNEIIRVEFVNEEDAVAMKLKGIPDELKQYLKLVNYTN